MKQETAERILAGIREAYRMAPASPPGHRRVKSELERFLDYVREGEEVLEVGCGDGAASKLFLAKGASYAGVDFSAERIKEANARHAHPEAEFSVGDVLELPVEEGRLDAVVASTVLQHLPGAALRRHAVRELARAARKGGYVFMAVRNLWQPRFWAAWLHQRGGWKNGWEFGDLNITWKVPKFPRYYHAYGRKELRRLCAEAGLAVTEQYYAKNGEIVGRFEGDHLVTIARKA